MRQIEPTEDRDEMVALFRETADGFGCLMAAHVKLARLEFQSELKTIGRQLATLAALTLLACVGYALICLGLVVVLSRWFGLAGALCLMGGVHVLGATSALFVARRKRRNRNLMPETAHAVGQSLSALTAHKGGA